MRERARLPRRRAPGASARGRYKFNVLVTTWEVVMGDERDGGQLARIPWDCVIVDEVPRPRPRAAPVVVV